MQGGGWQSNKDLLDLEFYYLRKSLLIGVNDILGEIYVDDASIKMINSWRNYTMFHC